MKEERNTLQREVFPKLRKLCVEHGFRFQAIDLRWGAIEEAGLDQQTMKICLDEIERSQKVYPRPNFIVLLGNRYGWQPVPYQIPINEFEEIYKLVKDENDRKLLDEWFCRNDNTLPPFYYLNPRKGIYEKYENWQPIELKLHSILLKTASKLYLNDDDFLKYHTSAIEQEIVHGALKTEDAKNNVFCFFRNIVNFHHDPDFIDIDQNGELNKDSQEKLENLKKELRQQLPEGQIKEYNIEWMDDGVDKNYLNAFSEDVYKTLENNFLELITELNLKKAIKRIDTGSNDKKIKLDENVQFSVYQPREVIPDKWYRLLSFAYLSEKRPESDIDEPNPIEDVESQAKMILKELSEYENLKQFSKQAIPEESQITFRPHIEGVTFNPEERTFKWLGESVYKEEFGLKVNKKYDGNTLRGEMTVFMGSMIIAEINLQISVNSNAVSTNGTSMKKSSANVYRKIFASYSHKDSSIVEIFEHFSSALGDKYLRDQISLRTGELWNDRIMEMIEEADIFQLFWSWNSINSNYVKEEYEYALSLNRAHFIRPVYWEEPLPEVPDEELPPIELKRLHFQRIPKTYESLIKPSIMSLSEKKFKRDNVENKLNTNARTILSNTIVLILIVLSSSTIITYFAPNLGISNLWIIVAAVLSYGLITILERNLVVALIKGSVIFLISLIVYIALINFHLI